ncbi:MAG: ABC transporter substrate-binding protein [Desulfobacteraceae bacterium]|nr:ABC transporter substrate-binding protein [Desulfobacteraceae bacterium]
MRKATVGVAVFAMLVGLAGFFCAPADAQQKEYINGIDANFPPFAFVDKTGKPDGFDVAVVDLIAKEMGFKVKHQPMDWDTIIPSLNGKKIDFIASGMSINDARKKEVNFTLSYWNIKQVLVAKAGSGVTPDAAMADGKKIGVQRGTTEAKWIEENLIKKQGKKFELVFYDSAPLAIEDVINGRIIAAAMDDAPGKDAEKKKPVKIIGTFGMPDEEFGYAVRKQDTELLNKLNEGLKKVMASPQWGELQKKYGL